MNGASLRPGPVRGLTEVSELPPFFLPDPGGTIELMDKPFQVGEFLALPASNELKGPAGVVRLRPLLMQVLRRLAADAGNVVSRESLIEDVWARRMVNDEVLSRAVAELRTALGDDPKAPRYIETLPKAGYRMVAAVSVAPEGTVARARGASRRLAFGSMAFVAALGALAAVLTWRAQTQPAAVDLVALERQLVTATSFVAGVELEVAPRFSPDGKRVAYTSSLAGESRIVVEELATRTRKAFGRAGSVNLAPVFFPDNLRIAYWRGSREGCAFIELDTATGSEREIGDCADKPHSRFDLLRDGSALVYTGEVRPQFPAGLKLRVLATNEVRTLSAPAPGDGDDTFPRVSPDGKRIAFFRGNASSRRVWTADLVQPELAQLAGPHRGLSYGLAWLGNDGPLLVAADWFGFRALNTLDLRTGEARLAGARGARFPDRASDGTIIFEMANYRANLWRVPVGSPAEPGGALWKSTRYTGQPEYSPDGNRVVFSSNREGTEAIYVAEPDTDPVRLRVPDGFRYIRPHWSADGKSILAVRVPVGIEGNKQFAVRINVADSALTQLEQLGEHVADARESRDGKWIYYGEQEGHAARLFRREVAGNAVERLPLPLVQEFQLNAARLVFLQPQLAGLTTCELATLRCEPLGLPVDEGTRFDWALGDKAIYYPRLENGAWQLARYGLAEKRVTWTTPFVPTGSGTSVAPRHDDTALVLMREEPVEIDLMIASAGDRR
jgi:DNA-binding winged helix-turn-helix (wHTH) protein/Tol biopolymer transport system component